jgi:putative hydrolase of the HAD superfamily
MLLVSIEARNTLAIQTILFDADGVLQRPSVRWQVAFGSILGTGDSVHLESFLQDIFEAESNALCTPSGFEDALRQVLTKWRRAEHLTEALRALNAIDVYDEVMRVVLSLQHAGVFCHIASNQQAGRARHMSEVLNYRTLFTREFYSCTLGVAKPDITFFERILRALNLRGDAVLFLDDRLENVEAARCAGLAAAVYAGENGAQALHRILADHGLMVSY